MNSEELMGLIRNPAQLTGAHVPELERIVADFPYFQPAHLLLAMAARQWDASAYQRNLKKAAIVAASRERLFELVEQAARVPQIPDTVSVAPPAEQQAETVTEVPVEAPEITKQEPPAPEVEKGPAEPVALDLEIGRSVVNALVEKQLSATIPEPRKAEPPPSEASFGDWLALMKKNNGENYRRIQEPKSPEPVAKQSATEPATPEKPVDMDARKKKMALIDKIIETNPGLIRGREDQKFYKPEIQAKESLLESEHLVTETLAKIYALQGNTAKAIRTYEILSLKNPQKSAYFAALIQQLRNNQNPIK